MAVSSPCRSVRCRTAAGSRGARGHHRTPAAEAKIAHLARHDMLTNLPNRVLFREHLENAFERIQPGRASPCIASTSIISRP